MKLYCIFIVFLFTIIFQPNIFGQNQYPVAFNGTIAADFYSSDQSNFGKFHGYVAELDISPLYYFHKTDNALTGYRYAIGMRTGITRWVGIYDDVDDLRWYLNVLPLARVYLNKESFFELSVGAKMQMYKRIWKQSPPSNIWVAPYLKILLWQINLSIGHGVKVTERINFEPIIGIEYVRAGLLDISRDDNLNDEEELGIKIRLGFQYRLFE